MKNSRDNFGKAWKEVFEGAALPPKEEVWTKIDSRLSQDEVGGYKRKLLFYKLTAAASILLAIGIGIYSLVDFNRDPQLQSQVVTGEISQPASDAQADDVSGFSEKTETDQTLNRINEKPSEEIRVERSYVVDRKQEPEGENSAADQYNAGNSEREELRRSEIPGYLEARLISDSKPDKMPAPEKRRSIFDEPWIEFIDTEEQEEAELWAGINLASGMFDPNISYGARSSNFSNIMSFSDEATDMAEMAPDPNYDLSSMNRASSPERNEYQPEISYAYGLNVGYQIDSRLMIFGGLSYMYSNSSTTANSYIENTTTNKRIAYQLLNANQIDRSGINTYNASPEDIELNNTYEFLSVPVKIGYSLIDKKFEWIILGGVSADFLLQNQIYDKEGYLNTIEIGAGESSPYNSTYLNGSLGTMLNYTLSDSYRFSLEPSYRLGLSYLTKEDAGFNSRPTSFLISAGVSYIFK